MTKEIGNKPEQRRKRGNPAWVKDGPSPNPDGRPALPEEVRSQLTATFLAGNPKAIERLAKLIDSDDESIALKAALGWLAKTIKDGVIIELVGKEGEAALETKVTHGIDPASALRVIRLLVSSGALPAGVVQPGEAGDATTDEVRDPTTD